MTGPHPDVQGTFSVDGGLEYRVAGNGDSALVFLHHGLGSAATWRDLPEELAISTGRRAFTYSRRGHGASGPLSRRLGPDFMHEHARTTLPRVLEEVGADDVVLIGHSDGASIALILAGDGYPISGLVLIAPHVFVEPETIAGIEAAVGDFETGDLGERLARYHDDPEATFRAWSGIWLDPLFRSWTIVDSLPGVATPTLVIQAIDDEYGTMAQIDAVEEGIPGPVQRLILPDGGHSPHLAHREQVIDAIAEFVNRVRG
jgi:pimeloyl-ACP methyl ester carboxylesterase